VGGKRRTVDGRLFHERAHDASATEKRRDLLITRSLPVSSAGLGVSGICDVVEFQADPEGIRLTGWDGTWRPYPVEYKKGAPKAGEADELQLCCQAMCLEEMLLCAVPEGSLFYGEPRRRTKVTFDERLREKVRDALAEMQDLYARGRTPIVRRSKSCNACSLKEICLPGLPRTASVAEYLQNHAREEETS